ncbi:ATP-binding protein [Candidatus Saccharibacteria bacterium]|nr:ATP-binding protein [Candidatus Saccharibacteria bacterium]
MIKREIESQIKEHLNSGKTIIIYGARQVGKTTLLHQLFDKSKNVLWLNGDIAKDRASLDDLTLESARLLIGDAKTVIIDEAQRIEDIGLKLKILHDGFGKKVQFIATGSSSFELANKINEPMTGRKWTFRLSPLSVNELISANGLLSESSSLEARLRYGSYPDVVTNPTRAAEIVTDLANDNLYKDVLNLTDIIKTDRLSKILKALAFQIGSQVSMNELAELVSLDNKTIDKYISLLEQAFIVFRLPSFGRNLRNELKSSTKIYFYDVGIRNALIEDFRPLDSRQDIGSLFENYIIAEFQKKNPHHAYFWRTSQQQEVDYLTEYDGNLSAAEIKWSEKKSAKLPSTFTSAYRPKNQYSINRENYLSLFADHQFDFLQN